ncbi:MAG: S46 family peptidase, partial [Xanthomonadales bacterium]|nr:S46 family peptidase [Xanthomonadales bacterium]
AALLAASPALALDGKWTPSQVLEIDPGWLQDQGLELTPKQLWDAKRGTGLLTGAVKIGGCSGAFVSSEGLIVTNHHCLFPLIQEHSTPERDLISDGFLARKRGEELAGSTLRVEIPRRFTDVSSAILKAVPAEATPEQRMDAIEAQQKALIQQCEKQPDTKCTVAVFDEGVSYTLIESMELRDVRLVYAPPRA